MARPATFRVTSTGYHAVVSTTDVLSPLVTAHVLADRLHEVLGAADVRK